MFKELFEVVSKDFIENGDFDPKDFKVGDKVIVHWKTESGNYKKKVQGEVTNISKGGLWINMNPGESKDETYFPVGMDYIEKAK